MDDELYNSVDHYYEVDDTTPCEKLAVEFGERYAIEHTLIDDEFWAELTEHFSDTELLELAMIAGYRIGVGRALQVLDVAVDFDENWTLEPST